MKEFVKGRRDAIILVVARNKENNSFGVRGTGFMISADGYFVTCAHVVNEIEKNKHEIMKVLVPGGKNEVGLTAYTECDVRLIGKDDDSDVALIKVISLSASFSQVVLSTANEQIDEGDEGVFMGFPLANEMLVMGFGITMTANKCMISAVKRRGTDGSLHFFLIDSHANKGSSGSPLFSVKTGKVIGFVSASINQTVQISSDKPAVLIPANLAICRPAEVISLILKKNNIEI